MSTDTAFTASPNDSEANDQRIGETVGKAAQPDLMAGTEPVADKIADFSKWNGNIDFRKAKAAGLSHAIIRSSNGINKVDPFFLINTKGCIDNKIKWGCYHFFGFTQSPLLQAEKVIDLVKRTGALPSMPVFLDTETNNKTIPITAAQLEAGCHQFLEKITAAGYDAGIYMSPGFSWFLPKGHSLGKYKLWAADFTGSINPVNGWKKTYLHQYTEEGRLAGVTTNVDLNRFVS